MSCGGANGDDAGMIFIRLGRLRDLRLAEFLDHHQLRTELAVGHPMKLKLPKFWWVLVPFGNRRLFNAQRVGERLLSLEEIHRFLGPHGHEV